MNRIDRLFGILVLLQSRKHVSAESLAEKFGISVRTVYRDIRALGEQGIPLSFEPHKGYFIVQGYFLPPVCFSSEEANALLLMERLVQGFADRSIQTHYTTALNKVKSVLKTSQKEKLEQLDSQIRMQIPACIKPDFDYLSTLQQAISHKIVVVLTYKNKEEVISRRLVEPIGLIYYAFSWHVIGWCQWRLQYRDFRVSRILEVELSGSSFEKTAHIPLADYMKQLPVPY